MYFDRALDLHSLLKNKSFFLFGPRATGKSSLIAKNLPDSTLVINLLRSDIFLRLTSAPWQLEEICATRSSLDDIVVIDEIQKVPILLNEVHRLIEEQGIRFLLTGSSARALKKQGVNLLGGRARQAALFPLTFHEIPDFDLDHFLQFGGLPAIYLSDEPREDLMAYVDTYLKEEIQAEAVVRKIPAFARFLQVAALSSGQMLNFHSLASDIGLPASTTREYYQVLEYTLLGFFVPAWIKSQKRKPVTRSKFYLFDIGVRHQLADINTLEPQSDRYGQAFEHFIAMELRAYLSYTRKNLSLSYWTSQHGFEVDFIIGDEIAIEVKTTQTLGDKHLKGLLKLKEESICKDYYIISMDKVARLTQGIQAMHWQEFLRKLWAGEIV
ncbi:MAG: ATP-binding protein [Legionellales bacterium]|jgi:predicted AAA+ superfamily ATPase